MWEGGGASLKECKALISWRSLELFLVQQGVVKRKCEGGSSQSKLLPYLIEPSVHSFNQGSGALYLFCRALQFYTG